MKHLSIAVLIALVSALVLTFSNFGNSSVRVYDCGMAEWHPDIPADVKEECRKIRQEHLQNEKRIMT